LQVREDLDTTHINNITPSRRIKQKSTKKGRGGVGGRKRGKGGGEG